MKSSQYKSGGDFFVSEKRNWDQVFKDCEASGMTIADFCNEHHISVAAFYKNKKALRDKEDNESNDVTFTQINIQEPEETITFTINDITITCNRKDVHVFLEVFR